MRSPLFGPVPAAFFALLRWTVLARCASTFLCLSLLTGCLSSEPSIGVVDSAAIVQEGAPGRSAVAHLAQVREILQNNLNVVSKKLESYPDTRQAQEILLAAQSTLQTRLKAHEQQINSQLTEFLQSSVREYRNTKKLSAIFGKDSLMDYDPALNVSADILVLFNKENLQLPPMPALVTNPPLPAPRKVAVGNAAGVQEKSKAPIAPKAASAKRPQTKDDKGRK